MKRRHKSSHKRRRSSRGKRRSRNSKRYTVSRGGIRL